MKQRLCLGRSLIHDPPALVMDEPAAGLDPRARIELRDMINHLAAEGKSILISSHILTELAEMCDRVAIIERGRLLVNGTVDEIRNKLVPNREVKIRVLGETSPVENWLAEQPGISQVRVEGDSLRFAHNGPREDEVEMLRAMVLAGLRIAEFGSHITSLEEVFMRVTKGEVQ
jgi:ABC-2 type transport system ATP-binding protein